MANIIHSEIGSHPADWSIQRVDSLFDIQQGKSVSKAHRQGSNQKPFLRTKNIFWGKIDFSELDQMHFTEQEEARLKLQSGDLLLCEGGDVGRTAIWNDQMEGCYYQNHLHRLRAKIAHKVDPKFALYWFWYAFKVADLYIGRSNVTTIPNLSQSKLSELQILEPEIDEQRQITHVLNVVQTAVEQQARLIELTRELKAALMKNLFTEGLLGEKQKETEIGPVPETWIVERLSSLFTIKHGFGFKGEYFKVKGTYILLTPGHFFEDGGFRDQKEKTKFYTGKIPEGFILQKGDLLIAMTEQKAGLLGSSIIIPESNKYLHNQRLGLIQNLDHRLDKDFLFYYFNTSYPRREIFSTATGSKVRHTSPSKVLNLKIAFPKIEEQKKIADTLKTIDRKLVSLNKKNLLLQELFRTLLHQLMTGQIRVNNVNLPDLS